MDCTTAAAAAAKSLGYQSSDGSAVIMDVQVECATSLTEIWVVTQHSLQRVLRDRDRPNNVGGWYTQQ